MPPLAAPYGEFNRVKVRVIPLPLIPSHKGRGNGTFYEAINIASFVIPAAEPETSIFNRL